MNVTLLVFSIKSVQEDENHLVYYPQRAVEYLTENTIEKKLC